MTVQSATQRQRQLALREDLAGLLRMAVIVVSLYIGAQVVVRYRQPQDWHHLWPGRGYGHLYLSHYLHAA